MPFSVVTLGAAIPQCANGTNILIPLPGPVSAEDMAVTGAGARLHAQDTSCLSLLYDFEELEGELDFLTRVVALTFYPAMSGSPITLGEVEVLGVSLPWRGIFTHEGLGARLCEYLNNHQKETNPYGVDTNPFAAAALSNEKTSPPVQPDAPTSLWVDLLTGGDTPSDFISQPVMGNSMHGGGDLLDFLDDATILHQNGGTDSKITSSQDGTPSNTGAQQYINCFKFLAGPHMERKLDFMEAMKLEIERLRLNLSAAERDKALLSIGTDPASINPNALLDESYTGRLCRVANSLALLGQASLEDKITASIGLATDDTAIDFWNITGIGESCAGGICQVRAEAGEHVSASSQASQLSVLLCSECERKVCKVCCAGRGALLLATCNSREVLNYNGVSSQGGSFHRSPSDLSSNRSVTLDGVICKQCCHNIILDALILDYVRVLISLRRRSRADAAAHKALDHVIGFSSRDCLPERNQSSDCQGTSKVLRQLVNGEESLAEFPFASFLHPVETAAGSVPVLSLLAPFDSGSRHSYWKAPPSTSSVEFVIVLSSLSDVSGVVLLVSPCGYSMSDAPTVQIWASNKIHKEERSCMGKWDVRSLITSSSELHGPEQLGKEVKVPRHVKFAFRNTVRCRIIWIALRLQRPGSNSVNFERDFNLLSLDENPFSELDRSASFGGPVESEPCLHAKRVLVVGSMVREDMVLTSQGSDQINLRRWLEKAPQLNRFKVPIEAERVTDSDLVMEQYLSPTSPSLAGFRLDGFSAIKSRVTHSPSSDVNIWDTSLTFLEDRHISPAVLYIQVSAFQEPHNMVTVAEYRLPEVKAGTAMYFDFPRQIQTRRISFRLLGDVTAFTDEPAEQDDSDFRAPPLAVGLSLSNRIKLFYYADPYELGKWASLWAV